MSQLYTTGEVAKILGIRTRKLKYFAEQKIFIPSQSRQEGKKTTWLYSKLDIVKLRQLVLYQELGYPNAEIKRLLNSPVFDWRSTLRDQIKDLKAKKQHIENSLFVLEILRYSSQQDDGDSVYDISDFDNNIDQFAAKMFIPNVGAAFSQGFSAMSSDIADSLSVTEMNRQGEIVSTMLLALRDTLNNDPDSDEVQNKLSSLFRYLGSVSNNNAFDPNDILLGVRLISNLSIERIMDMFWAKEGATEFLMNALEIFCNREKEDEIDG